MDTNGMKAQLQMIGSRVKKLEIENNFVFIDDSEDDISKQIDVSYRLGDPFTFDGEENSIAGNIIMTIDVKITNEQKRADIKLEIDGSFELDESDNEELLKEMLSINGCAALYSVARGIISSVTSHMCPNGTVLIPMLNMYKLKEKREDSDEVGDTLVEI